MSPERDLPLAAPRRGARRALGVALLLLTLAPFYRMLAPERIGPFGVAALVLGGANLASSYSGLLLAAGVGFLLATFLPTRSLRRFLDTAGATLAVQPLPVWAGSLGALTALLSIVVARGLFHGLPTSVDEMASLLQARFLATGSLAGPPPEPAAAFVILNTIVTPAGWVSLYPPSHLVLLAAGLAVGAVWLVGPVLAGVTVAATAVAAELLLAPERRTAARVGGLLAALSPFVIFLGGGYLSHVSAAAFVAVTACAGLLAARGHWGWGVLAGASVGLAVTSRPWTGLVLGTAFTGGVWLVAWWRERRPGRWLLARCAAVVTGGAPFAAAWFAYNARVFGHPLRLGYTFAYGPAHGLGFHQDPWGNLYGAREALGYTSANLIALGIHLLETPFPAVALVAAWLVVSARLPRGAGLLVTWAALPVAANVLYWHHGFHLGPRMLYEAAPAWAVLVALAGIELARSRGRAAGAQSDEHVDGPRAKSVRRGRLPSAPDALLWALAFGAVMAPGLAIQRALSYRHTADDIARFRAPVPPSPERALVFVHGSWSERMSAKLQGDGMTLDSLETALRRNDVCDVQAYVTARVETDADSLPPLDFEVVPGYPARLHTAWLSPGNRVLMDPTHAPTDRCRREALADRDGVVALAPLSWQSDLPGIEDGRPVFVRDLGPEGNQAVLERYPDRTPYLFFTPDTLSAPELTGYAEGLTMLWGSGPPAPPGAVNPGDGGRR